MNTSEQAHADHVVLVLDDDKTLLSGLERLLSAHGFRSRTYSNPDDFFKEGIPDIPACLLLDNNLGENITGVQVHQNILEKGWFIPTVFLTGNWDVQLVVDTMRSGADGFLTKPFDPDRLISEVRLALQRARDGLNGESKLRNIRMRANTLTEREKQVITLVAAGKINKEIADELHLALVTVKVHRARAMKKLGAGNPAELAHLAAQAGLIP